MWIVSKKLHYQTIINLKRWRAEMIILVTKCMSTWVTYGTSDLVNCPVRDRRFGQKSWHFLRITKMWLVNCYTHIYTIFFVLLAIFMRFVFWEKITWVTYGTSVGTNFKQFLRSSFGVFLKVLEFRKLLKMDVFDLRIIKIYRFHMFGWYLPSQISRFLFFIQFHDFS